MFHCVFFSLLMPHKSSLPPCLLCNASLGATTKLLEVWALLTSLPAGIVGPFHSVEMSGGQEGAQIAVSPWASLPPNLKD